MVLVISQETFNEAVSENIREFGMTVEEAVEAARKQFEAQGGKCPTFEEYMMRTVPLLNNIMHSLLAVLETRSEDNKGVDLTNITEHQMASNADTSAITNAITELSNLLKGSNANSIKYQENLIALKKECDKNVEYRVFAGKEGAYNVIMDIMSKHDTNEDIINDSLKALIALMTKQPDLLNDVGTQTMIALLDKQKNSETQSLTLKWIKECCILHERNREHIFEASVLDHLKPLLKHADSALLRDVLGVLRTLVLDDDIRVEFGRSYERARVIASDTLCSITVLLSKFNTDETLMNDVMLTLSALLVRNEFCKNVQDAGTLEIIKEVMVTFVEKEKLIKQCFKLLKALGGNDEVKSKIIQLGFAPVITSALNRHKGSSQACAAGLACLAALTLRSEDSSKAFFEADIPEVIAECMKLHLGDVTVQKNASWAIRNMVSRSRYQNEKFLSYGIEDILKRDLKKFKSCEYDIKSALRDLGCDVKLKEEWTGKGGKLTTQATTSD